MKSEALTCIGCPLGCRLSVTVEDGTVRTVDHAGCARGVVYARQECVAPMRTVTSLVRVRGRRAPLSVKTAEPVPKELIFQCLERIHGIEAVPPVRIGDVLIEDVCGTGVNVVATSAICG